jgi:hypothetical protein
MAERISEILSRVGDDVEVAKAELYRERSRKKPRVTLIEALSDVIDSDPLAPPCGLGMSVDFWNQTLGRYQLRVDERRLLEDACREMDLIDRLEEQLRTSSLMEVGSQGQPVASPLVSEIRQHRSTLRQLLAQLKLPDEPGEARTPRSVQAREAARARWGSGA